MDYGTSRFALGQELSKDARVHYAPGQTVVRDPLFSTSGCRPSLGNPHASDLDRAAAGEARLVPLLHDEHPTEALSVCVEMHVNGLFDGELNLCRRGVRCPLVS